MVHIFHDVGLRRKETRCINFVNSYKVFIFYILRIIESDLAEGESEINQSGVNDS